MFLLLQPAAAQVRITGYVVDGKDNPVPYATVMIADPKMPTKAIKANVTKNDGSFTLEAPEGEHAFSVRFLGYKTVLFPLTVEDENVEIGKIKLAESLSQIEEVVVKPLIEINARDVTYNIESDPDREKSSMFDILGKMPLVSFDYDDKPVIADNASYVVLRNGRRDPLFDSSIPLREMLVRLPAMGFTKITITSAPPARFSNYEYAINIIADKTKRLLGMVGSPSAGYNFGNGELNLSQSVTGSADKLRFNARAGYETASSPKTTNSSIMESYSSETIQELYTKSNRKSNAGSGCLNLSQDITRNQFLAISFSYRQGKVENFEIGHMGITADGTEVSRILSDFRKKSLATTYNGKAGYEFEFNEGKRILSFFYDLSHNDDNADEIRSSIALDGSVLSRLVAENPQNNTQHYISTDYSDKFFNSKLIFSLIAGYLASDFQQRATYYETSAGTPVEEEDRYRLFERSIRRLDGTARFSFLTLSQRMHIQSTTRWDYFMPSTKTTSIDGVGEIQDIDESGMMISSGMEFTYYLSKDMHMLNRSTFSIPYFMSSNANNVTFAYDLAQRRPTATQLSNFVDKRNPLFLTTGNPELKNEYFHRFRFSYANKIVRTNLNYAFSPNRIARYWYMNDDGQQVETYTNSGRSQNIGVSLGKNINLSRSMMAPKNLNINVSGTYSKLDTYGKISENFNTMVNMSFITRLFSKMNIMSMLVYRDIWASGYSGTDFGFPLTGNITLFGNLDTKTKNRLNISVSVSNIGSWKNRVTSFVDSDDFTRRSTLINKSVPISFSLSYFFGKFEAKEVRKTKGKSVIEGFSGQDD